MKLARMNIEQRYAKALTDERSIPASYPKAYLRPAQVTSWRLGALRWTRRRDAILAAMQVGGYVSALYPSHSHRKIGGQEYVVIVCGDKFLAEI